MDVPDHIVRLVLRRRTVAGRTEAREEENYGWVEIRLIDAARLSPHERDALVDPEAPMFLVYRWDVPKHLADDDSTLYTGTEDHAHVERFETQDIYAAFQKAAEYQPDWSKWDDISAFDNCW